MMLDDPRRRSQIDSSARPVVGTPACRERERERKRERTMSVICEMLSLQYIISCISVRKNEALCDKSTHISITDLHGLDREKHSTSRRRTETHVPFVEHARPACLLRAHTHQREQFGRVLPGGRLERDKFVRFSESGRST